VGRPARYDGIAEWYDRELATAPGSEGPRETMLRFLGDGPGRLLDLGCGTGAHTVAFVARGWETTGVDISSDQLRLARRRRLNVVQADATALPFDAGSFDAVVSMLTHTDADDFGTIVREAARVLRPGGVLAYVGVHPCFVGPHSRFVRAEGVPTLYAGYRATGRYTDAPGITRDGLRAKVGAVHLPLGLFLQLFLDAGLRHERVEEPGEREYPHLLALKCRR
jgi:SAM-dependent methyltransferase